METRFELTKRQKRYLPIKRALDIALSGAASIVLAPVMGVIALAIKFDSPGPILFRQKRVGKNKELFEILKFRTMRTDTPKDMPTHMLQSPDQYITRVGRILRKTSLDELPQIWQIFAGDLTIIGPRPALWNQDDLIAERDKYGANDITPGLTGWAQINGRDELEIPVKARFDGEYVQKMGLKMDLKCFLGTIGSVLSSDGVVEGGTGEICKEEKKAYGIVSSEKLKKELKTGAVVVGTSTALGIAAIVSIGKQVMVKKNNKKNGIPDTTIVIGVLTGMLTGIATFATLIKRTEDKKEEQRKSDFRIKEGLNKNKNDVTCSIVTYNSANEIDIVLSSLAKQVPEKDIYVIDNASTDETVDIIRKKYSDVKLIESDTNLGFGAGHNYVIKKIHSRYHIIVNPDIQVDDGTIQKLSAFMDEHPDVVCATPLIHNVDGSEQYLPKRYPKFKYLLGGKYEEKFKFAEKLRAEYTRKNEMMPTNTDIDFCSGCFMFIRTDALLKIGGFDERYFLHFEDADLTRMLQKVGRTVYVADTSVTHKWKRDNTKNKKIARIAMQSMLKYFMKWGY